MSNLLVNANLFGGVIGDFDLKSEVFEFDISLGFTHKPQATFKEVSYTYTSGKSLAIASESYVEATITISTVAQATNLVRESNHTVVVI